MKILELATQRATRSVYVSTLVPYNIDALVVKIDIFIEYSISNILIVYMHAVTTTITGIA